MKIENKKDSFYGFLFVLPALLGTLIFIIIPIFVSFTLSFTDWDLLNEITFVGLNNYRTIFTQEVFSKILINTLVYAISTTFFAVLIPLFIAEILNTKLRGAEIFKTIYFIPFITPAVVIAIVWLRRCGRPSERARLHRSRPGRCWRPDLRNEIIARGSLLPLDLPHHQ